MGPNKLTVAVALTLIVVAGAAIPSEASSRPRNCTVGRGRLVIADPQALVTKTTITVFGKHHGLRRFPGYRGCTSSSSRSFVLGPSDGECGSGGCGPHIGRVALGGMVVAFERSASSEANPSIGFQGGAEWLVVVRDLRNGRTLHSVPTGATSPPRAGLVGNGETTALVVKPDGAVAWINDTSQESARYEVHALDRNGSRVLAVSSGIDRSSLALAGSTLYWTANGMPLSAKLN